MKKPLQTLVLFGIVAKFVMVKQTINTLIIINYEQV